MRKHGRELLVAASSAEAARLVLRVLRGTRDIAQFFSRICGCSFAPSVPAACQLRFFASRHLYSRTETGAPSCRDCMRQRRILLGSKTEEGDRCKLRSPSGVVYYN